MNHDTLDTAPRPAPFMMAKARFVKLDRIGTTATGERINAHYRGETIGAFGAGQLRGVDYAVTRPDGRVVVRVEEVVTCADGAIYSLARCGIADPVTGTNELRLVGTGWIERVPTGLGLLDDCPLVWKGSLNKDTGELHLAMYTLSAGNVQ